MIVVHYRSTGWARRLLNEDELELGQTTPPQIRT
jgi:hypothetical protein